MVPAASAFGGLLLLGISAGACLVQLFVFHGDVVHTIVLGALSAIVVWAHQDHIVAGLDRPLPGSAPESSRQAKMTKRIARIFAVLALG